MGVYLIGCLHLGHDWMAKHRGFSDSWEHDEWLEKCWNSVVGKRDKVFILGDITMNTHEHYYKLDLLNGDKHVILGNHDNGRDVRKLLTYVNYVSGPMSYRGYMLSHIPVHPNEIGFTKANIHAHIHHVNKLDECVVNRRYGDNLDDNIFTKDRYYNVDAKLIDYKPVNFEVIEQHYDSLYNEKHGSI